MHIQDIAGVAHDDIDPSVFSISGDEEKVRCPYCYVYNMFHFNECFRLVCLCNACIYVQFSLQTIGCL